MQLGKRIAIAGVVAAFCLPGVAAAEDEVRSSNWYFSLDALALGRSAPSDGTIMSSNPGGTPYFVGSDFDFGVAAGAEAIAGYHVSETTSIEARFLYSKMSSDYSFTTPGNFIGVGFIGPGATSVVSDYHTRFVSGELNWRQDKSDRLSVLAGLRAMDIEDTMRSVLSANVATGLYEAENSLVGAQIGAEYALRDASDPFQLDLIGKLGVFANGSSAGIREFQGNNFIGEFRSDRETETSYAIEIGVKAGFQLSEKTRITAGYQAMWVNNLALASNAASESRLNPSLLNSNIYRDDLLLHGFTLGLRVEF